MNKGRRNIRLSPAQVKKLVVAVVVTAVILVGLVLVLRRQVKERFSGENNKEVVSAEVTTGSISTSVYGSGLLTDEDVEELTIPSGVEIEKIYVSLGEKVEEGQLLASVNPNSVVTAMAALNEKLETLDDEINSASSETVASVISSSVSGRVKKIYVSAGDDVADAMYENGALMLISLDGYMAADVENSALAVGDTVVVTDTEGKEYSGTVSQSLDGVATVLITDNGPVWGDSVTLADGEGFSLGSGKLYIHDELKVMGYAGTVAYVPVSENRQIYSGSSLISLTDTEYSANYDSLLKQRRELENELQQLISIYKEGAVYSDISGTIKVINATEAEDTDTNSDSEDTEEYFSISPDKTMSISVSVDESEILSVSVGQSAFVTVDSIEDESFEGTVTGIDKVGTSSSGVTTYTAEISIDKTAAMLSGMSASAVISIGSVENALLIPIDALNKTSTSYYVYTSWDEETQNLGGMVEVSVGITNSSYAEITGGLSEGDTVYYIESEEQGLRFMSGGMDFGGGMPGASDGRGFDGQMRDRSGVPGGGFDGGRG